MSEIKKSIGKNEADGTRYTKSDQLHDEIQKLYNQLWKHKPVMKIPIYLDKNGKEVK